MHALTLGFFQAFGCHEGRVPKRAEIFRTDTPDFVYVVSKRMFGRCVVFVDSLFWL